MKTGTTKPGLAEAAKKLSIKSGQSYRRRAMIVRRAAEIFHLRGYNNTSLEEIAVAVGVKREALYYYFRSKSDILYDIIKPESDYLASGIARIMALEEIGPREKLTLAIENHMSRFNPNYLEMAVALRELDSRDDDPRLATVHKVWRDYQDTWVSLIDDGIKKGVFSPALDARLTAFAILGMCNSPSTWFRTTGERSLRDIAEIFIHVTLNGITSIPDRSP
jgi:AcrR family transcriptional regulator